MFDAAIEFVLNNFLSILSVVGAFVALAYKLLNFYILWRKRKAALPEELREQGRDSDKGASNSSNVTQVSGGNSNYADLRGSKLNIKVSSNGKRSK